jgi:hypothetical protein
MDLLATVLSSIFGGGATGLLGVILQRFADYKNKQLDMQLERQRAELEIAKRRVDAEIAAQEWAARTKVAQIEGETAQEVAQSEAFKASLFQEPSRYSSATGLTRGQQWILVGLDTLRGSVRPLLTLYLCVLTTLIWLNVKNVLGGAVISPDFTSAIEIWKIVVGHVLYLSTVVTLWWFGTRNKGGPVKL